MASYLFSYWILGYYTAGDQEHYTGLYDALRRTPFGYIIHVQYRYTGSKEPLYGIIMWVASSYFEKKVVISIFNAILISSLFLLLAKRRVNYVFMLLMMSNFYLLVLLTSAERLKFAYIFAILAAILPKAWRGLAVAASLLSHFSVIIVFLSILVPQRFREALQSLRRGDAESLKGILALIVTFSLFLLFLFLYQEPILQKVSLYTSYNYIDASSAVLLFMIAMWVTRDRTNMLMALALPLVATFILGGQRVNMLTVSIFLYYMIKEGRTAHPAVLAIMAYFSFKSVDFMQDVMKYGTGFVA
ncbi:hypothetical protein [Altererythrobacter sp. C41]|uniref:hypothetical protein n=1 Tax=Altererythrobacter sp. C41 TaxID=2806021 RepID=UPI00193280BB|nr:hypothetical protein [Altererythrobacter sp. C41]MBM0171287.1 hypothetical protein [Altererythrobacter sp. C41]